VQPTVNRWFSAFSKKQIFTSKISSDRGDKGCLFSIIMNVFLVAALFSKSRSDILRVRIVERWDKRFYDKETNNKHAEDLNAKSQALILFGPGLSYLILCYPILHYPINNDNNNHIVSWQKSFRDKEFFLIIKYLLQFISG
jgi:hypothetical protein